MNVTHGLTSSIYQATAAKAVAPVDAPNGAAPAQAAAVSAKRGPLFTGGLLNYNALMAPDMLGALFALDDKGEVQFQTNGAPILKKGESIDTPEEQLLSQHLTIQYHQKVGNDLGEYVPKITDEEKKFFHDVTGYNLITEGPLYGAYDDQGNLVPDVPGKDGRSSAVWQLVSDIAAHGLEPDADQNPIDADWYASWKDKMSTAGSPLPEDWATKARAYFHQALEALFEKDEDTAADPAEARQDLQPERGAET